MLAYGRFMSKGISNQRFFLTALLCVTLFYVLKMIFGFITGSFVLDSKQFEQCAVQTELYRECFVNIYHELVIVKVLWVFEVLILVGVLWCFILYLIRGGHTGVR